MTRALALSLCLMLPACATTRYYYRPSEPTALTPKGVAGVTYAIAGPHGLLRMAPLGLRKLPALGERPVFVVRYYLENKSNEYWKIDPRLQKIGFDGQAAAIEPGASSLDPSKKSFEAKPGKSEVFDLIYAVPAGEPGKFAMQWQVDAAGEPLRGLAAFERAAITDGDLAGGYVGQDIQVTMISGAGGMYRSVH